MEVVQLFIILFLGYLFIMVYKTVTTKGYDTGWAILAMVISMIISPIIVLLICLYLLPDTDNHTWDD
jgi:hypothetical protein